MWFKNLLIYRFTKPFTTTAEALDEALQNHIFQPCTGQDTLRYGWVKPLGHHGSEYTHVTSGNIMVCLKRQEKTLPSSIVNEAVFEQVLAIESQEDRKVGRKERIGIKDEIIFDLMPRALPRSALQFAYIAPQQGLLLINASSHKRAEELMTALRDAIGSLPVIPITAKNQPQHVMTHWLSHGGISDNFTLGHECELKDNSDESAVIRCKHQDLQSQEINSLIQRGMYVSKLGLNWNDSIDFIIDEELSIKRITFSDVVQEKAKDVDTDSMADQFDVDFSIMSLEFEALIKSLLSAFGGEDQNQNKEKQEADTEKKAKDK